MRDYARIVEIAKNNNGFVRTSQVVACGIAKTYLASAVDDKVIEKVATGLYKLTTEIVDELYVFQQVNSKVIFAAFTSAYLLGLTTRDQEIVYGTVPMHYNSPKLKRHQIVGEKDELYNFGIMTVKTPLGNEVVCHDACRTICDLFSDKFMGDKFVQVEALKTFLRNENKNTLQLMQYAIKLGVDKPIREKLEVLL